VRLSLSRECDEIESKNRAFNTGIVILALADYGPELFHPAPQLLLYDP
jgi:hypothetical protein